MQLTIENPDYSEYVNEDSLVGIVRQLAEMAMSEAANRSAWNDLTLYLLDDAGITAVNRAVHGHDFATDVISQRYDPVPGEPPGLCGEIFVNLQCACREGGRREGWTPDRELALYIAHGCDHLNDCDDQSEEGFKSMRARELRWLDQLRLTPVIIKPII